VSLAAPYPGTYLHTQARANGWLQDTGDETTLVNGRGEQTSALAYPHLGTTEIFESVDLFYRRFYFRAGKIAELVAEMARSRQMLARRLREGTEFLRFLSRRTLA